MPYIYRIGQDANQDSAPNNDSPFVMERQNFDMELDYQETEVKSEGPIAQLGIDRKHYLQADHMPVAGLDGLNNIECIGIIEDDDIEKNPFDKQNTLLGGLQNNLKYDSKKGSS